MITSQLRGGQEFQLSAPPNNTPHATYTPCHTSAIQHMRSGVRMTTISWWLRAEGQSVEISLQKEERQMLMSYARRDQHPCLMPCLRCCAGFLTAVTPPLTGNRCGRDKEEELNEGDEKSNIIRPKKYRQTRILSLLLVGVAPPTPS